MNTILNKKTMLKFFSGILLLVLCHACKTADDPSKNAKAFLDAFAGRDFKTAANFASKDSKTLLDLVQTMVELQAGGDFKTPGIDKEFLKEAVFEPAKIEGDRATIKVSARGRSHVIKLVKEDGQWKVALDKEALEEALANEETETIPDSLPDSNGKEPEKGGKNIVDSSAGK